MVVDIYLPDMKFGLAETAARLCAATDYVTVARDEVKQMFSQVGFLRMDSCGRASAGLIVRHLILPGELESTRAVLEFLAREISPEISLSLMAQYYPAHRAAEFPELARPLTEAEYREALDLVEEYGFENGWIQELESRRHYRPDFTKANPFHYQPQP
ncbi:MAG: hypothetical protein DRP79_08060 [Planctomycetota bacterium]|nr:MAG: hypothetical protein DRP79_08060 [Planctomycetota bacterium]